LATSVAGHSVLRFGVFELNILTSELRKAGMTIKLRPQSARVLTILAVRGGELVSREELRKEIWGPETFVDFEHSLNLCISEIRAALDDAAETPRYIETLPRRGYRFIAPLQLPNIAVSPAASTPPLRATVAKPQSSIAQSRRWWRLFLAATLVALLLAGVGGYFFARRRSALVPPRNIRAIAVLPLENFSHDPNETYFADGMTDELITDLAQFGSLKVISRTSVMRFKSSKLPLPEIARQLNVDAIVEGSVLRSGDRIRITAQLIQAATDQHLWAQTYERDARDVLRLQADVARDVAHQVRAVLTPQQEARLDAARTIDRETYDLYLKGLYLWNQRTPQSLKRARELFQQAVGKDPGYALAWVGLSNSEYLLGSSGYDVLQPRVTMPRAKAAAQRAIELDDGLGEAHVSLAMVLWAYEWNWPEAEREHKRALELNPSYAVGHQFFGIGLSTQGRFDEAIAELRRAQEMDPLSLIINVNLGRMLLYARRYDEATTVLHKTIELQPNFYPGHQTLGYIASAAGRHQEALTEFKKARELAPDSTMVLTNLVRAYARAGQRSQALASLEELKQIARERYVPAYQFTIAYAALGDMDRAFVWLDKAVEERSGNLMFINVEPVFDDLRADPRFPAAVRRMGLQ